jgi:hypothetical protein
MSNINSYTNYFVHLTQQQLNQLKNIPDNLTAQQLKLILADIDWFMGEFGKLSLYSKELVDSNICSNKSDVSECWRKFIPLTKQDHEYLKKIIMIQYCDIKSSLKSEIRINQLRNQLTEFEIN